MKRYGLIAAAACLVLALHPPASALPVTVADLVPPRLDVNTFPAWGSTVPALGGSVDLEFNFVVSDTNYAVSEHWAIYAGATGGDRTVMQVRLQKLSASAYDTVLANNGNVWLDAAAPLYDVTGGTALNPGPFAGYLHPLDATWGRLYEGVEGQVEIGITLPEGEDLAYYGWCVEADASSLDTGHTYRITGTSPAGASTVHPFKVQRAHAPEPSVLGLVGLTFLGVARRRRR